MKKRLTHEEIVARERELLDIWSQASALEYALSRLVRDLSSALERAKEQLRRAARDTDKKSVAVQRWRKEYDV